MSAGAASGSVTDNAIFEDSGEYAEALRKFNKLIAKLEESCVASAIEVKATSQEVDRLNDCISRMEDFANASVKRMDGLAKREKELHGNLKQLHEDVARLKVAKTSVSGPGLGDCIIIRGLAEIQEESPQRIISVRRVGKPNPDRPRLVMVKFQSEEAKLEVKRLSWKLGGSNISIDHALTSEQLQQRSAQWPLIKAAKEAGQRWSWSDSDPVRVVVRARRA
eukprot:gene3756-biopygen21505